MSCSAPSPAASPSIDCGRTVADLERWLAEMPPEARAMLAEGPWEEEWTCAVCRTLRKFEPPLDEPEPDWLCEMWDWHADAAAGVSGELHGLLRYLYCILVYVYAGWEGYA